MKESAAPPLIVTADPTLSTELLRLAAAAGVVPDVVDDIAGALRRWAEAPLVLVGSDLADAVGAAGPPRRTGVHLVTTEEHPGGLYPAALACAAESVHCLPSAAAALVGDLTDSGDGPRAAGVVVGVIGGAGGVGASVFAAALAEVLAGRTEVLLIDADPYGAGIDRVLGLEEVEGVRWDGLVQAAGRLSARSLRDALPRRGRLAVLTWSASGSGSVPEATMRAAVSAGRRGYAFVVIDLARYDDPVAADLLVRCDQVLLVATTTVPAIAAAARMVGRLPAATRLVLRTMGGGVGSEEVAGLLGLPVLTAMRDQRGLDEAIGLGLGPLRSRRGPLARAARAVADAVVR